MPSRCIALVPFRSPGNGKTRLSRSLDRANRAALVNAMLADVVTALAAADVAEVVVAAGGASAAAAAAALGVTVVDDPVGTTVLDDAVRAVASRFATTDDVLVVMADLPLLTPEDVRELTDSQARVVIAATHDGGTGGLLRRPHHAIPTAYGDDSAERHHGLAVAADASVESLTIPGFRYDVDTEHDLLALAKPRDGRTPGKATAALLPQLLARRPRPSVGC